MKVLYQDENIIVCIKPSGILSTDEYGGMPDLIKEHTGGKTTVYTVHRLDSVVSGLMVYALSKTAASVLSEQIENGGFIKEYFAVLEGHPEKDSAKLTDYLRRNERERKTYVCSSKVPEAQEAELIYSVCGKTERLSLVKIRLLTGRTHQIRAQFSARSLPLCGDIKYGSRNRDLRIALWSCCLKFRHPVSGENMEFSAMPPQTAPWTYFEGFNESYDPGDVIAEFKRKADYCDCRIAKDCGGCEYAGMDYSRQLEKKNKLASACMRKYAVSCHVIPSGQALGFKARVLCAFTHDKSGDVVPGFYSRKLRRVIPQSICRMNFSGAEDIFSDIALLIDKYRIPVFSEKEKMGDCLKSALLYQSKTDGSLLLNLIGRFENAGIFKELSTELKVRYPGIKTVILSDESDRKVERIILGEGYIVESICGKHVRIYPRTNLPTNIMQAQQVFAKVMELAELDAGQRILDINCGTGILGIIAADSVEKVLCLDFSSDAIKEAKQNAADNGSNNIKFICSEATEYIKALTRSHDRIDTVFINLSGSRINAGCMNALAALAPGKIICIINDAEKLDEYLSGVISKKYKVAAAVPFDMIPFARQLTAVISLVRI